MCNLYRITTAQEAMRRLFADHDWLDLSGNLEPGEIYPDRAAPIVRIEGQGLVLQKARWGLPTPPQFLSNRNYDKGVTNVRNTASPHWRRWLGPDNRCLVPFTMFAEPNPAGGNAWFETREGAPAFFAGIQLPNWTSVRKVKDGSTTDDLYAFLTTSPNAVVGAVHPKAMPVILTTPVEWEDWLTQPWDLAKALQRPLRDGELQRIAITAT